MKFAVPDLMAACQTEIVFHEDDFIYLVKKPGNISGVGTSAKEEGIGTIHWKLRTDNGKYLDVYIENAPYVPTMDLQIAIGELLPIA